VAVRHCASGLNELVVFASFLIERNRGTMRTHIRARPTVPL